MSARTTPSPHDLAASRRALPFWKVWLTPLLILAAAVALALASHRDNSRAERQEFERESGLAYARLRDRVLQYELLLRGGLGLLNNNTAITSEQWAAYAAGLRRADAGTGAWGLGFAPHVPASGLARHLAREHGVRPGYAIHPAGRRDEYCPLVFLDPLSQRNQGVIGFDLYTDPVRREALDRARDTGETVLSGRTSLTCLDQDRPKPGCLLFVPVYLPGAPARSVAERRAALLGFVSSPLLVEALVSEALGPAASRMGLTIRDDAGQGGPGAFLHHAPPAGDVRYTRNTVLDLYGRRWILSFSWPEAPLTAPSQREPLMLLALGAVLAGAVLLITRNLDATRARAVALADRMTSALRQSDAYNRALFQHSSLPVGVAGPDGRLLDANPALVELLGYPRHELLGMSWRELTHPEDLEENARLQEEAARGLHDSYQLEKRYVRKDGGVFQAQVSVGVSRWEDGGVRMFIAGVKDISELRAAEQAERRRQTRRAALLRLHEMRQSSRQELLDFALEQMLAITGSEFGFVCTCNGDARELTLAACTPLAMEMCAVSMTGTAFPLDAAGLWGEAVRLRRSVLLNDFSAPHPGRRGLPPGHVEIRRFLSVPIFGDGRVMAVVGVANKPEPYVEEDEAQLRLFSDGLWSILERQEAERGLRELTERFQLAVRAGRIGLWEWDMQTGQVHVDEVMRETYGLKERELPTSNDQWLLFVHPEDREAVGKAVDATLACGGRFEAAFRVLRADGSVRHVEASALMLMDSQGRPARLVGVNIDATSLREAEYRLAHGQRFVQSMVDTLPHTFFCKDAEGRYLLVNQAFARMHGGAHKADYIGKTVHNFEPPELAALHHDWDQRLLAAEPGSTMSYGYSRLGPGGGLEHRMVYKSLLRLHDESLGIVGFNVDDTSRKLAEDALREERRRFSDVILGTNAGTWEWNVATGESAYNERWAEILGHGLAEIPQHIDSWRSRVHPEDMPRAEAELAAHFSGTTPYYDCELRMRHKDGHWIWVHTRGRVFQRGPDGAPLVMSGTHSDISARKLAEERLALVARFPVENPNPVLRADKDGALLFANPAAGPLLDNWGQSVGGKLPQELLRELDLALETGQARHSERSYVSGIYSFTLTPFMDKGYVNIYAVDVTQRKSAEMALRLSELRYRELAVMLRLMCDNVPDLIWAKDMDGRYLFANKATCEQYLDAADPQAVLGRTDEHFLRRLRAQRPDDPAWNTLRLGGGGGDPDMAPSRFEQSGANRGRFETFEVRTAPFVNDQGSIIGSVGAARSITERKAAEDALARSEERFRTLAQVSPVGIFQAGIDGRCTYVNDTWAIISGFPPGFPLALGWLKTLDPQDRRAMLDGFREMLRTGADFTAEFLMRSPGARRRWVLVRAAVLRAVDGAPTGFVGALTDITERKATEDALRRAKAQAEDATRAKAQFLANMSHEIRTPLAGAVGAIRQLARTSLDEEQQSLARMAQESARALLAVVNDILDFSKIEAGRLALRPAPFSLRACLDELCGPCALLAKERGLDFTCAVDPLVPDALLGDADRLGQVLRNFLSNALKFTHSGGVDLCIALDEAAPEGPRLRFSVTDTGVGIDPGYLPRIFDSFSQGDSSYAKEHGGTGLGLAICKSLVERMGGSISIDSAPGQGATVYARIPFRLARPQDIPARPSGQAKASPPDPAAPKPAPRQAPLEHADARGSGDTLSAVPGTAGALRVLLAEDNAIGRVLMEHLLTTLGHEAVCVGDGLEVLAALKDKNFDLVLMDVQMPRMDGLAATRQIRQGAAGKRNAGIAVVALTAYASGEDRQHFLDAGMDEAVAKPAEEEALMAAMRRALDVARQRAAQQDSSPKKEHAP